MMQPWPADHVERWALQWLVPFARNARTHSPAQVDQIAASMREWGWTNPVLVDEAGTIIAGHGRVDAARKLGLAEALVMVATGWSEAKKRAYVIVDNKLALNAGWDEGLLAAELSDLKDLAFDLDLVGFNPVELGKLLGAGEAIGGEDDVPDVPEKPVSRAGDLWLLGAIACSAGMPPVQQMSCACSAARCRSSWSPTRRTASTMIPPGATTWAPRRPAAPVRC
jgi:hypothetical protein